MAGTRGERSDLMRHLFQCHHGFESRPGLGLDLEELHILHQAFHTDKFMSTSHEHIDGSITNVKVKKKPTYVENLIQQIMSMREVTHGED